MMSFRFPTLRGTYCLPGLLVGMLVGLAPVVSGCAERQDEPVVALVNGRAITQAEFDLRWDELSKATRSRYEKEGGKRQFLDELITRELLMQEARRRGLDRDDTIRDKTQRYKEQLILDELLKDKLQSKVELTQAELDAYYEKHANQLLDPLKAIRTTATFHKMRSQMIMIISEQVSHHSRISF